MKQIETKMMFDSSSMKTSKIESPNAQEIQTEEGLNISLENLFKMLFKFYTQNLNFEKKKFKDTVEMVEIAFKFKFPVISGRKNTSFIMGRKVRQLCELINQGHF